MTVLYAQRDFPVFQNVVYRREEEALACPRGDISLVQDQATGLVHNAAFDPARVAYDGDYQNEQGLSAAFRAHLDAVRDLLSPWAAGQRVLEIGCGKGTFLAMLREAGHDARGIDPTYEGNSPHVEKALYPGSDATPAGLIVLRHVLEHIPRPFDFLAQVRDRNGGGLVYIEVPCLDWIAANRAWFDIYYEHVNYFRAADFAAAFSRIVFLRHTFSGQYIALLADLASLRDTRDAPPPPFALPDDFLAGAAEAARALATPEGAPFAVWGASSKGVIFTLLMQRAGLVPRFAIDINPVKQGRYMAGSGVPIVAPAEAMRVLPEGCRIVVVNANYLAEVRDMTNDRFQTLTVAG